MSSQKITPLRRVPKQDRAETRIRQMLAAAEAVIDARGLEAATMTEIAASAGISIGAVYQYFPNKEAIASTMRTAYAEEMDKRWSAFLLEAEAQDLSYFSNGLVELLDGFIAEHPAYLQLFSAAVNSQRSELERDNLRKRFAQSFMQRSPALTDVQAQQIAEIALTMVKSLVGVRVRARATERKALEQEMKYALLAYLTARLTPA